MIRLTISYLLAIIFSIIIYGYLTNIYINVNFIAYTDIMSYLEYINLLKEGKMSFFSMPRHYFLRLFLPFVYAITNNVLVFSFFTYLIQFVSNFVFYFNINIYTKSGLSFSNIILISTITCIAPGVLFSNVTMKSEWPSIFIFGCCLYLLCSKNILLKSFSLPISLLSRPSLLITIFYQFFFNTFTKNKLTFTLFFIISPPIFFLIFNSIWSYHYDYSFLETGFYTPFSSEYGLRDFFKISHLSEFWRIPGKIAYSLLLESNVYIALSPISNPENLNNLNGILRLCSLLFSFYMLLNKNYNKDKILLFLFIYFSLVIPPIILTGFYQTRYFITADLVLYFFIFKFYISHEKISCKI